MKRTPLKRVSKKRAADLKIYYALKTDFLREKPQCECSFMTIKGTCQHPSTGVHHIRGRGKLLNAVEHWLAVCSCCHDWIHSHPNQARKLGLLQ